MKNKIFKSSPLILAIYLFVLGCFYLVTKLLGYTFVPFNGIVLHIVSVAIVVLFTVGSIINREERTKISAILAAFLPLIAMFFVIYRNALGNLFLNSPDIYPVGTGWGIINGAIILVCSIIPFFIPSFVRSKEIAIAAIIYTILLIPISLSILFSNLDYSYRMISPAISPNSVYLAEIADWSFPAPTAVIITHPSDDINLFIGKLRRYEGAEWIDTATELNNIPNAKTITLQWETDEILHFLYSNGEDRVITMQ